MYIDEELLRALGWVEQAGQWSHPVSPGTFDLATAIEIQRRAISGYRDNTNPNWEPAPIDLEWLRRHLLRMGKNNTWSCSDCVFRIDKQNRKAYVLSGAPQPGLGQRSIAVFRAIGWEVLDARSLPGAT